MRMEVPRGHAKRKDGVTRTPEGVLIVGDAPGGNYRAEMIRQGLELPPGLHHMDIYHDDWCSIFRGGLCDCDPDIVVRKETPCT